MTADEKRTAAIHDFYKVYRELQKYDNLRLHTRESIYDEALIEVYRYHGEKKDERVIRITQEDAATTYIQATDQVRSLLQQAKERRAAERRRA